MVQMVVMKVSLMVDIIMWEETDHGDYASSDCPCSEYLLSLASRAFRFCGGDLRYVDATECVALSSQATRRLCQAVTVSQDYLHNNNDMEFQKVANATVQVAMEVVNITSNSKELTAADITSTATVLDLLTGSAITDSEVQSLL